MTAAVSLTPEQQAAYAQKHVEHLKRARAAKRRYYASHKKEMCEKQRDRYHANLDSERERFRDYYAKNKEKKQAYYRKNKEKLRAKRLLREAQKKQLEQPATPN